MMEIIRYHASGGLLVPGVFKKNHITIIRAQIDPTGDEMGAP